MSMRSLFAGLIFGWMLLLSTGIAPAAAPPEESGSGMICKVYAVADLIVPIAGTFAARTDDGKPVANRTHEDRLIQIICSALSPASWRSQGGQGSINYYPLGMALVVRQTPEMQEQVAELLAALRKLQDTEVSVELRFVTVSDECLAKLGVEDADGKASIVRLDDAQVRLLLEAAQSDTRTNIMQAPKLTVFNGQRATLDLTEKQLFVTGAEMISTGERKMPQLHTKSVNTGLQVTVLPVVAPDNRSVTLQLGVSLTRADVPRLAASQILAGKSPEKNAVPTLTFVAPQEPRFSMRSFQTTVKLTDGTTALISGWTQHREQRNQICPPVLSKIPYIGQLFRTISYGKEREHLLVLVTPRVIVQQEKEERVPAEVKPSIAEEAGEVLPADHQSPASDPPNVQLPGPQVMHVRQRRFRLDYPMNDIARAAIGNLDVWYTRDTKQWVSYGHALPIKGHATITVSEDGRWGFTLIPRGSGERSPSAPKRGDEPQVWVEVDTVPPVVFLMNASTRMVDEAEKLSVRYRCEDAHLKSHPVTISYSTSPDGPWSVLSQNQEASGTFTHPLRYLPSEFYVRVEAQDEAGNVGWNVSELIRADANLQRASKLKVATEE